VRAALAARVGRVGAVGREAVREAVPEAVPEAAGEPGVLEAVARTALEERMYPEMTRTDQSRARLSV